MLCNDYTFNTHAVAFKSGSSGETSNRNYQRRSVSQNPQAEKRLQQPEADCIPLLTHHSCLGIFHLTNFFPKRKNRNTWQLLPETCIRFDFPMLLENDCEFCGHQV